MDNEKELRQVYDILTAAWRAYREHYPPGNPQDDTYWSKLVAKSSRNKNRNIIASCAGISCAMLRQIWSTKQKSCISQSN